MRALLHEARLALLALQFLTRVPVPQRLRFEPAWLQASARHFPLVGLCVGAFGALVLAGAAQLWPLPVAVVVALAATAWLTGGFHEDGLADTFDGLGGHAPRERALAIMKDPRVGSHGALALGLVLALKGCALWGLAQQGLAAAAVPAWLLAHAGSRAAAVALLWRLPYAGDAALAKARPMAQQASAATAVAALGWVLALAGTLLAATRGQAAAPLLAAGAAMALVAWQCARWFRRRLGGCTGDTLGAAQQLAEAAALLGWLALAGG
ncbi:MAG: adenosylcobinamide-GDP ribazoletransferase [Pseudomonadota bacterium]